MRDMRQRLTVLLRRLQNALYRSKFFHLDHVGVVLMGMIVVSVLGFLAVNMSIFSPLKRAFDDFSMTDIYYHLQRSDALELNSDIVLVDMTELHDRGEIGQVIHEINQCSPKVLAVDLIFQNEGGDVMANAMLVGAIDENPEIIFSSKLIDYQQEEDSFAHLVTSFFSQAGDYHFAYGNVVQKQSGGIIRDCSLSMKMNGKPFYSFAYATACKYKGVKPHPQDPNIRPIIYGDTDFLIVKAHDVKEHAQLLKDKIVLLGTISSEEDAHVTPIGKMAGMKIQAFSIFTILKNRQVTYMSVWTGLLLAFILCYISAWVGYWIIKWIPKLAVNILNFYYFLLAAILVWIAFLCWVHFQYQVNLLYPLLGIALVEKGRSYYSGLIKLLYMKKKWKFLEHSLYK